MNTQRSSAFGLVAWLESTQIHLPLKAVECRFDATGAAADVQIDQIFHQLADRSLDVVYSFPLPSRAAVYRCEMIVNGRVIRAKVEKQGEARRLVQEKKEKGYRTSLVEMERGNLFTLSLGNVQPGDLVVIRFAYIEELDAWKDDFALRIPFTPGVRYIPGEPLLRSNRGKGSVDDTDQVPDASRITPPRIDGLHPDAALLALSGKLDGRDVDLASVCSRTHAVAVRPAGTTFDVFVPANSAVPDRDFVLEWRRAVRSELLARAWVTNGDDHCHALLQLRTPDTAPIAVEHGADIYFLVDRSGSMQGEKWQKTAEALVAFVEACNPRDRIAITFFESTYRDFAEGLLARDVLLADPKFRGIVKVGTAGGTELLPALRHVVAQWKKCSADRRSHVVLITDGQVGNEDAIAAELAGLPVPMHCFGIDTAVNEAFLRELAASQGGSCVLLTPTEDIVRPVEMLGSRLSHPLLAGLLLNSGWIPAEGKLPDLYAGQVAFISLQGPQGAQSIFLEGKAPSGEARQIAVEGLASETSLPKLLWAKRRIDSLLRSRENAEAIALAKEVNIVCRGAAFVAWDEAEKVSVAADEVYQPSLEMATMRSASAGAFCAKPRLLRRETNFFESRITDYRRVDTVTDRYDYDSSGEFEAAIGSAGMLEKTSAIFKRALSADRAERLVEILREWAKHTPEFRVVEILSPFVARCEAEGGGLKNVFSKILASLSRLGKPRQPDSSALDEQWLLKAIRVILESLPEPWKSRFSAELASYADEESRQGEVKSP